eukprot:58029-Prymnesium_polylepis.1
MASLPAIAVRTVQDVVGRLPTSESRSQLSTSGESCAVGPSRPRERGARLIEAQLEALVVCLKHAASVEQRALVELQQRLGGGVHVG